MRLKNPIAVGGVHDAKRTSKVAENVSDESFRYSRMKKFGAYVSKT
jgi:hypothetical protein